MNLPHDKKMNLKSEEKGKQEFCREEFRNTSERFEGN